MPGGGACGQGPGKRGGGEGGRKEEVCPGARRGGGSSRGGPGSRPGTGEAHPGAAVPGRTAAGSCSRPKGRRGARAGRCPGRGSVVAAAEAGSSRLRARKAEGVACVPAAGCPPFPSPRPASSPPARCRRDARAADRAGARRGRGRNSTSDPRPRAPCPPTGWGSGPACSPSPRMKSSAAAGDGVHRPPAAGLFALAPDVQLGRRSSPTTLRRRTPACPCPQRPDLGPWAAIWKWCV